MTTDWRLAWIAVLDAMELDVAGTETLLADSQRERDLPPPGPWTPPDGLGPLPLDLQPRADAILARQLALAAEIGCALATTRRQAEVAHRLESGRNLHGPAYVDQAL